MTSCQPSKIVLQGNAGNKTRTLDTNMVHLPSCQMIRYKPVPLEPEMPRVLCPQQEHSNNNNVSNNVNVALNNNVVENFQPSNAFDNYASI